jgi:glycogen debranching enzyme
MYPNPWLLGSNLGAPNIDALKEERLEAVLEKMENEYGIAGIVDVVWNHTAINSPWLGDHPEATYNILNCPYLTPAFIIDQARVIHHLESSMPCDI